MKWMLMALPLALAACGREESGTPMAPGVSEDRVKDLVCHMMVDRSTPLKAVHEGATYHFCADVCLEKFKAEPKKYAVPCLCARAGKRCTCEHCGDKGARCDCHR